MRRSVPPETAAATAGLIAGAALVLTLVPWSAGQAVFPPLTLGLVLAVAGLGGLALTLAALAATTGTPRLAAPRLEAAALWSACGLALLGAVSAVAASAESLNPDLIVRAQHNTSLYLLRQPVAAAVYLVALALAGQRPALQALLGPASLPRAAADAAVTAAVAALGATLFLGGWSGSALPGPVWVLVKTALVAAALHLMRRRLGGLGDGPQLAIAWAAAIIALANLGATLALVTP